MQRPPLTRNGKSSKQFPARDLGGFKSVKEFILEAPRDRKKVHFDTLIDIISLLKNAELEPQLQKYKSRVVLRGDIEKDDSGAYAVEQFSFASRMIAAKNLDVIARLPGCDGQAADAVSAYTEVKMEDA